MEIISDIFEIIGMLTVAFVFITYINIKLERLENKEAAKMALQSVDEEEKVLLHIIIKKQDHKEKQERI